MKKYNLSEIMKRAHQIKKEDSRNIWRLCLKMAWTEAKSPAVKSEKEQLIGQLNKMAEEAESHDNGYHYEASVKEWNNYGKSRTYFSINEMRDNNRHYVSMNYGYYDNQADKYMPHKYGDLTKNYTVRESAA